ncbi:coproporphyrinogen III oxidase [Planctomycetes bacterium Poly30]|uniref:Coproporphyrinogen III oxidase n=1 Tax=Saltatorellus ferox TaxID=2528018 RepID=A0A518ERY4_9BACT|nr:coproporphyrinogen III oxidase [Planctomycetes bacterium Poly30]
MPLPFRTLKPWLKERYGRAVYRVALDAGSTCPNRDGTKGFGGCTYCDVEGSGTGALKAGDGLTEQLGIGLKRVARRRRRGLEKAVEPGVIAYLQSYTNTYVDAARFREVLDVFRPHLASAGGPIVAVAVATRPDCVPDESLRALEELAAETDVWLELGLESASDAVLLDINRLHTLTEFEDAATRARQAGLVTVGHAILGLPGDGREGARATANALREAGLDGVKVHHLMVLKKTQMAHQWRCGTLQVQTADEYVDWLADFVERIGPDQVLHRITGDSPDDKLLAPIWNVPKNAIRERLAAELSARGTEQGSLAGR